MTVLRYRFRLLEILLLSALGCGGEPPAVEEPPLARALHYPEDPPSDETSDGEGPRNPWLDGVPGFADEESSGSGGSGVPEGSGGDASVGTGGLSTGGSAERALPDVLLLGYEETTGAHKYLTLENRGLGTSLAEECRVLVFSNGSINHTRTIALPSLAAGEVVLVCTTDAPVPGCGASMGSAPFNGDDALVVRCGEQDTDVFGRVGEDPGDAWKGGGLSTKDAALVRCHRLTRSPEDLFGLDAEWAAWPSGATLETARDSCPRVGEGGASSDEGAQE